MITTEQLEALKEGTPPGPWEWYWDQGIISLRGPDGEPIATDLTLSASDLLAASRTLVDILATMTEEAEIRIVNTDTNGGLYETQRWVRKVSEWRLDE